MYVAVVYVFAAVIASIVVDYVVVNVDGDVVVVISVVGDGARCRA